MDQSVTFRKRVYIIRCFLLKYRPIVLRVLKVSDEPLGEEGT